MVTNQNIEDVVTVTQADRDWLDEDTWASIPTYMHKHIVARAARHRLASTPESAGALVKAGVLLPCPLCKRASRRNGRGGSGGVLCTGDNKTVGEIHRFQTYGADQAEADTAWNTFARRALSATTATPASDGVTAEDATEIGRVVRWIDQAIERAKRHGNTEGIWLFASQWRTVRNVLASSGGNVVGEASRMLVMRDYHTPAGGHCPYQGLLHDENDLQLFYDRLFTGHHEPGLLKAAGIEDGDEFEVLVRKTGKRPFGDRHILLVAPATYRPETDAQFAFRKEHGRAWNYREDVALAHRHPEAGESA